MNYSSLMLGAVMIFAGGYYFVYGRKYYQGPVIEVAGVEDVTSLDSLTRKKDSGV
jgi:hypothetical protein